MIMPKLERIRTLQDDLRGTQAPAAPYQKGKAAKGVAVPLPPQPSKIQAPIPPNAGANAPMPPRPGVPTPPKPGIPTPPVKPGVPTPPRPSLSTPPVPPIPAGMQAPIPPAPVFKAAAPVAPALSAQEIAAAKEKERLAQIAREKQLQEQKEKDAARAKLSEQKAQEEKRQLLQPLLILKNNA